MALAEFTEFVAEKEGDDDEDNDPREGVLGRIVSQKQIEAVAAALPPGSRTLGVPSGERQHRSARQLPCHHKGQCRT